MQYLAERGFESQESLTFIRIVCCRSYSCGSLLARFIAGKKESIVLLVSNDRAAYQDAGRAVRQIRHGYRYFVGIAVNTFGNTQTRKVVESTGSCRKYRQPLCHQ